MLPLCSYPDNLTMERIDNTPLEGEELPNGTHLQNGYDPARPFEQGYITSVSREREVFEWEKVKLKRRVLFLKEFGYPSLANLKAENTTENLEGLLPLNIRKWKSFS